MQGDLVSGGLDAVAHLRVHDGELEPQKVSLLHLVAQLRMQDGKLESLVQGSCLEASGRHAQRWWPQISVSRGLARSSRGV